MSETVTAAPSPSSETPQPKRKYPGYGMNLRWMSQDEQYACVYPLGIHQDCSGNNSMIITVREVAMMLVIDRLTDKTDWQVKVFNDIIAEKWCQEAMAWPEEDLWNQICGSHFVRQQTESSAGIPKGPLLDRACVDYCIQELRDKAEYFKRTGIIPTLDADFSIAKSDTIVPESLRSSLREAFARLKSDQASRPDWHPNTNEMVQDLVHPAMYPLVYGRTPVLDDEVVGVEDAVDKWVGNGKVIPRSGDNNELNDLEAGGYGHSRRYERERGGPVASSQIPAKFWSETYQWLPANLEFTQGGGVRFTSYINGLHPVKYPEIYRAVEKLVEMSLPMWDQCLVRSRGYAMATGAGRGGPRLLPANPDDENPRNWKPREEPGVTKKNHTVYGLYDFDEGEEEVDFHEEEGEVDRGEPLHLDVLPFHDYFRVRYDPAPTQTLRELYKDTGLQVIVKMASIELTPEKPGFAPGHLHVEGMMNEKIAATALYYLDSENITESQLQFNAHTNSNLQYDHPRFDVSQDGYHWMQSVYGTTFGCGSGGGAEQNYGSVRTPQGRLLAFPNVFIHSVSGFRLADPTKPGHRRFIALWLVDPSMRIINTAMVPPQQAEWWGDFQRGEHLPMTRGEAEEHRVKLIKERSTFQDGADWISAYSFCEH